MLTPYPYTKSFPMFISEIEAVNLTISLYRHFVCSKSIPVGQFDWKKRFFFSGFAVSWQDFCPRREIAGADVACVFEHQLSFVASIAERQCVKWYNICGKNCLPLFLPEN